MKKWIVILAWFFAFEHQLPDVPGAWAKSSVGPFKTAAQCNEEREWVSEQGARFLGFKAHPCVERKAV